MGGIKILIMGAHPDDVEFGMGGSVLTFADRGAAVTICVLTRGEVGTYGTPEVRESEMRRAAQAAGAQIRGAPCSELSRMLATVFEFARHAGAPPRCPRATALGTLS